MSYKPLKKSYVFSWHGMAYVNTNAKHFVAEMDRILANRAYKIDGLRLDSFWRHEIKSDHQLIKINPCAKRPYGYWLNKQTRPIADYWNWDACKQSFLDEVKQQRKYVEQFIGGDDV